MRNSQTRLQVWLPQLAYALLLSATLTLSAQAADEPAPVTDEELNQAVAQLWPFAPTFRLRRCIPPRLKNYLVRICQTVRPSSSPLTENT